MRLRRIPEGGRKESVPDVKLARQRFSWELMEQTGRCACLALLLCGCAQTGPPGAPPPQLSFERTGDTQARVRVPPLPLAAHWTLQSSALCGATDGPTRQGKWPLPEPLTISATRADLLTARLVYPGQVVTVSDCVPPLGWNTAY